METPMEMRDGRSARSMIMNGSEIERHDEAYDVHFLSYTIIGEKRVRILP